MRISARLAFGLVAVASPVAAQLPGTGVAVDADVSVMSDYRFRGISRSGEDPALQGSLTASTDSGFYAGVQGTTLREVEAYENLQLDLYAGYNADLGLGTSLDAGMLYYAFPGSEGDRDYFEPYASLSYQIGPIEATAGAKYAWAQDAIGKEDMLYLFAAAEAGIPTTGITVTAHAGRQDWGHFGSYWNWSLGARQSFGPINLGVRYVDTDLPDLPGQDAGLIFSAGVSF